MENDCLASFQGAADLGYAPRFLAFFVALGFVRFVGESIWKKGEMNMGFLRGLFGKKESAHPNLFEEMQSSLRTTLIPLGFEEKEGSGRSRYAEYSRGELSVWLTWDIMDSIYYAGASSRSEMVDDQKSPIPDFNTECLSVKKADQFKDESIAKLNEWLVQQKVK